jgi:type II secretory pathway predicted ATPase ExeA
MTETQVGQRRRLFPNTPNTQSYYPASAHEAMLARMHQGIADGEGFLVLAGEPGIGKTLLCHVLIERLGSDLNCAFLTNSHFADRAALLQAILFEFSLPYEDKGEQELRLELTEFLLSNYTANRRTLLVIDEAQNLNADLLEELRLLGNLEAQGGKAVQIVIVGQVSLLDNLTQPESGALWQRIACRLKLDSLSVEEAADYLRHHVRVAGFRPETQFTDEGIFLLAKGSQGIPRILNQVAHQALALAQQGESMPVDVEAALEALTQLGLEVPELEKPEEEPSFLIHEPISMTGQDYESQPDTDNPVEQPTRSARLIRHSVMS